MKKRRTNHWLDVAEYASLAGVGLGSVASAIAQQFLYATAPLSLAVLIGMSNRRRMQALQQQAAKQYLDGFDQLRDDITQLTHHLKALPHPGTIDNLGRSLQQQQQAVDEVVGYVNATYSTLGERLAALEHQDYDSVQHDIQHLRAAHGSIHTLLSNLQASLGEMTTREQIEAADRAIAHVQQQIQHLDRRLQQLGEQTQPRLETLQQQVEQLDQPSMPTRDLDFTEERLDEIVNLMADLVPRRDWNTLMAQVQTLQRQYHHRAERDQQLDQRIHTLQQQIPDSDDSLAALRVKWQGILETVQDKIQALPNLADLDGILEEMLHRRLQTFPERARPHQLLIDLPDEVSPAVESQNGTSAKSKSSPAACSRLTLDEALQRAENHVILTWPWSSSYRLDPSLVQQMDAFLTSGKSLSIGWCSRYSRQEDLFLRPICQTWGMDADTSDRRTALQRLLKLKHRHPTRLRVKLLDSRENFLVVDRVEAVVGIEHPLTPAANLPPLGLKVKTTSPTVIASLIDHYRRVDHAYDEAETLWRQAMTQYDLGETTSAIAALDRLLEVAAGEAAAHVMRSILHYEEHAYSAALEDMSQAIQLNPQSGSAYCNRGLLRHRLGDLNGAIADFDRAIQLLPESAIPVFYRGRSWEALKRYPRALSDYNSAHALMPAAAVLCRRAIVYRHLQKLSQARRDLNAAAWTFIHQHNSASARRCLQLLKQWEQDSPLDSGDDGPAPNSVNHLAC